MLGPQTQHASKPAINCAYHMCWSPCTAAAATAVDGALCAAHAAVTSSRVHHHFVCAASRHAVTCCNRERTAIWSPWLSGAISISTNHDRSPSARRIICAFTQCRIIELKRKCSVCVHSRCVRQNASRARELACVHACRRAGVRVCENVGACITRTFRGRSRYINCESTQAGRLLSNSKTATAKKAQVVTDNKEVHMTYEMCVVVFFLPLLCIICRPSVRPVYGKCVSSQTN